MINELKQPEDFSPTELHLLIQHLKLGSLHLEKQLGREQFKTFLKWGTLNKKEKDRLETNLFERISHILPVLNTIVASSFGAFIGLSILLEFDQGDLSKFCVVCGLVILTGTFIGYLSVRRVKNQAKAAMTNVKINKVQLRFLSILNGKIDDEILTTIDSLKETSRQLSTIKELQLSTCDFKKEEEFQKWAEQLKGLMDHLTDRLPNEQVYELYRIEILRHLDSIFFILLNERKDAKNLTDTSKNFKKGDMTFIQTLTDPALLPSKTASVSSSSQFENIVNIFYQLIPTMLGAFASLFVFINGLPNLAQKVGIISSEQTVAHPHLRVVKLAIMLFFTLYFGIFWLYSHRKAKHREKEMEDFNKKIVLQETEYLAKTSRLQRLNGVKEHLLGLLQVIQLLKNQVKDKE